MSGMGSVEMKDSESDQTCSREDSVTNHMSGIGTMEMKDRENDQQ